MKKIFIVAVSVLLITLTACSPKLKINVEEDGEIYYSFSATLKDVVADTVRSFTGTEETVPLFDGVQIQGSLIESGLENVAVELPDFLSVKISGTLETPSVNSSESIDRLPSVPGAIKYCVEEKAGEITKILELSLSEKTMTQVLESLPVETVEYVDLLSAPVFTGEEISSEEYVELIGAIYGATVANALKESVVNISVIVPAKIQKAEALFSKCETKISGNSVDFIIPFADFLTQPQEVAFVIQY